MEFIHYIIKKASTYLKQYFKLNIDRHRTGKKAKLHFNLVTFIYNACKLAVDRMNAILQTQNKVS